MTAGVNRARTRHGHALRHVGKNGNHRVRRRQGRTMFGGGVEGGEQSQEVAAQIDGEVKHIIDGAYKKAEGRH
jgi:ATP-dependent Zn protease